MTKLYYVIGPSGAGKDSILDYVREHLQSDGSVAFAHRYITRPAESGSENHIALSEQEFHLRLGAGLFTMHWASHGLHYGIGVEIDHWLTKGVNVVVNGSRGYLEEAATKYHQLCPLLIDVPPSILHERLLKRGRESEEQITKRIHRATQFATITHPNLVHIDNSGPLHQAGEQMITLLTDPVCC